MHASASPRLWSFILLAPRFAPYWGIPVREPTLEADQNARWVGRPVPFGLLVGLSGVWMTVFYPRPEGASDLLYALRLFFGFGMILSIIIGFISIRRRDVNQHKAWMTRAYAIGMGAGTQVLTGMVGALILGKVNEFENALLMGAAWVINLAIAEWSIRKDSTWQTRTAQI
jgi:hypothetical protein